MIVSAIAAVAKDGCIGVNNDLPWHLPTDMRYFMRTTKGHHIITGRKNFEAMGKLKNRTNIIVTRNADYQAKDCQVVSSIEAGLKIAEENGESEAFIIGGGQIYKMALDLQLIQRLYITEIDIEVPHCEVHFPTYDKEDWTVISQKEGVLDEKNTLKHTFFVLEHKTFKPNSPSYC